MVTGKRRPFQSSEVSNQGIRDGGAGASKPSGERWGRSRVGTIIGLVCSIDGLVESNMERR